MAFWTHIHFHRRTWRELFHQRKPKPSTPTEAPKSRIDSAISISTKLATTRAAPSPTASSSISSESSSCSSSSSSSDYPSILPFSSTSLLALPYNSPPSSSPPPPAGSHPAHVAFALPTTPISGHIVFSLADRIALSSLKTRSQHDYLQEPLTQLLTACRPRNGSLDGPYPALDITHALAKVHQALLSGLLEICAKLDALQETMRQVDRVGTNVLARVENEIEDVGKLVRSLRRFEESVKRFLRGETWRVGGRREVIEKVRDEFSPGMRDAICEMNLLGARIQCADLELVRVVGRAGGERGRY